MMECICDYCDCYDLVQRGQSGALKDFAIGLANLDQIYCHFNVIFVVCNVLCHPSNGLFVWKD